MWKRSLALLVPVLAGCGGPRSPDLPHVLAARVQHCHAVSNGCIRLPKSTLRKVFRATVAGTPVIIDP